MISLQRWSIGALLVIAAVVLGACGSNSGKPTPSETAIASPSAAATASESPTPEPTAGVDFPTKPIRIFVPFSAGGATDLSVRALAPKLEAELGQPIEVVDKPGGAGALSMNEVLQSKADGYTIGFVSVGPGIITPLTTDVGYTAKDFDAVGGYMDNPYALAVSANSAFATLQDLVDEIKAKPNTIKIGTTGPSSPSFIGLEQFAATQNLSFQLIPFNGGVDAVNALLGNNVDAIVNVDSELLTYINDERFRALAIVTKKRSHILPDVPTADEQQLEGLTFAPPPGGLFVPKGTPAEVIAILESALQAATADQEVKKTFDHIFIEPIFTSAADFRKAYDEAHVYYEANLKK